MTKTKENQKRGRERVIPKYSRGINKNRLRL